MGVWAILRQRRWLGFTVFALAMAVLCVFLARWQWHRYQTRLAENARLDAALSAPAVDVSTLVDSAPQSTDPTPLPADLQWRTITATGVFDTANEVAVRRRPLDGRNGYWIVTPLVTDSGVLLVNRGWTAATGDATTAPTVDPAPTGTVTVTGRLRPAETSTATQAAPAGQAWATDPEVLVTPASTARYNAYLELRESSPTASAGLTMLTDPGHRGTNNLVYTGQWLMFGAVVLVGWFMLMRQEARRVEEADEAESKPAAVRDGTRPEV